MSRNRYFWAALLILLGGLLLANNLGYLAVEIWNIFWPLVLILAGIWFLWGSLRAPDPADVEHRSIDLQGAERAEVRIKHGAGRLQVDSSAAPGTLLSGSFRGGLHSTVQASGSELQVQLKPEAGTFPGLFMPWNWTSGEGLSWQVGFNPDVELILNLETGAGETHLNLGDLRVRELNLKTGASASEIYMPRAAGQTRARIEAGAAAVEVHIPEGVAARIRAQGGLASVEVNQDRFIRENDLYQSPGYQEAEHRVELDIEAGLGAIEVY
jgi:hypothetical protein